MYEEGVIQYLDAKQLAAKRILGRGQSKHMRFRPKDLPSNGEIADELLVLTRFHEGDSHQQQLFHMRMAALEVMESLECFNPRLIGSVSTGRIRKGSDIDLHLFTEHLEPVEERLNQLNWSFETKQVCIQKSGRISEYTHIYLHQDFPIELCIYPEMEIRVRGRSSTDGKPIMRLNKDTLLQMLMTEHSECWNDYLANNDSNILDSEIKPTQSTFTPF